MCIFRQAHGAGPPAQQIIANDDAVAMPDHYYNQVEQFLNRKAPQFQMNDNNVGAINNTGHGKTYLTFELSCIILCTSVNINVHTCVCVLCMQGIVK